jgi:hypothetical protein
LNQSVPQVLIDLELLDSFQIAREESSLSVRQHHLCMKALVTHSFMINKFEPHPHQSFDLPSPMLQAFLETAKEHAIRNCHNAPNPTMMQEPLGLIGQFRLI